MLHRSSRSRYARKGTRSLRYRLLLRISRSLSTRMVLHILVAQNLLAVQVSLALNLNVRIGRLELGAVLDVPLCHEIVLHPDDLVEGLDEGDFALDVEAWVGEDGFVHDVLDEA